MFDRDYCATAFLDKKQIAKLKMGVWPGGFDNPNATSIYNDSACIYVKYRYDKTELGNRICCGEVDTRSPTQSPTPEPTAAPTTAPTWDVPIVRLTGFTSNKVCETNSTVYCNCLHVNATNFMYTPGMLCLSVCVCVCVFWGQWHCVFLVCV